MLSAMMERVFSSRTLLGEREEKNNVGAGRRMMEGRKEIESKRYVRSSSYELTNKLVKFFIFSGRREDII